MNYEWARGVMGDGIKVRRKEWPAGDYLASKKTSYVYYPEGVRWEQPVEDVIADDWEFLNPKDGPAPFFEPPVKTRFERLLDE